jgi:diguanylate cyclase
VYPVLALTGSEIGAARPRLFVTYVAAVVISGVAIVINQFPQFLAASEPEFWLVASLAVLVAWFAFVPPQGGMSWIVISPSVCFTFAILLCWGLGPAVVPQILAVAVSAWRVGQPFWPAVIRSGQLVLAFGAAYAVLLVGEPDPFGKEGPINVVTDVVTVVGAVAAWLGTFSLLLALSSLLWRGVTPVRAARGTVGHHILYTAALLMLSPVLGVAAHVNVLFVPLVFVPLFAVQRMARLSDERDRAVRLDPLTGLANRAGLSARFDELTVGPAGSTPDRAHRKLALLVLDLDRFKHVNDALGHQIGDQLLVAVAGRLAGVDANGGIVARLGGDEFAILARVADCKEAHEVGVRITNALNDPATLDGLRLDVTASVGIALLLDHGEDFPTLMRHADVAMYEAKKRGDAIALYEPHADHNTPERLGLLTDFRRALETKDSSQIALHYQPQVSLEDGRVVGVEALLRWRHPAYGLVRNDELLHVAEHTSVMHLLTSYVIDEVLTQVAAWEAEGINLRASLNISARDLYSGDIATYLAERLAAHDVSPDRIQLEITESAIMADPNRALATTSLLANLGVEIALDDFGTGYSSLQHLRKLPLTEIKIDRSFVAGLAHNSDDASIVASTVEMARSMGLRTVAEGVENEYTRRLLAELGCTLAQGWFSARPMPAAQISAWLTEHGVGIRQSIPVGHGGGDRGLWVWAGDEPATPRARYGGET